MTRSMLRVSRRQAARCADVVAVADAVGTAALALMFAFEVPKGGPFIFGTTNDALGVVHHVLFTPVMAELSAELPAGPARDVLFPASFVANAVGAASGALLIARVLPLAPSSALSIAAMEVQAAWLYVTSDRLLRRPDFPRDVGRLGRLVGAGMLGGGALAGLGLLLPRDGALRRVLTVAGGAPMALAWLAWPEWFRRTGRYLHG